MMTVAQLTCMEAYCLWMYVIVVYLQLDIVVYLVICIEWLYISQEVFFGILDQFQHSFSQMLVFPWLIVDMC